jgi:hypothetical protein
VRGTRATRRRASRATAALAARATARGEAKAARACTSLIAMSSASEYSGTESIHAGRGAGARNTSVQNTSHGSQPSHVEPQAAKHHVGTPYPA